MQTNWKSYTEKSTKKSPPHTQTVLCKYCNQKRKKKVERKISNSNLIACSKNTFPKESWNNWKAHTRKLKSDPGFKNHFRRNRKKMNGISQELFWPIPTKSHSFLGIKKGFSLGGTFSITWSTISETVAFSWTKSLCIRRTLPMLTAFDPGGAWSGDVSSWSPMFSLSKALETTSLRVAWESAWMPTDPETEAISTWPRPALSEAALMGAAMSGAAGGWWGQHCWAESTVTKISSMRLLTSSVWNYTKNICK